MMEKAVLYLICINLIAFAVYGIDKWKAVHKRWRISEGVLFGLACIGGSFGALMGMYAFRHKIRKALFRYGIPLLLILQTGLMAYMVRTGAVK